MKKLTASRAPSLPRIFVKLLLCAAATALWAIPGTASATLGNYPATSMQLGANATVTPDAPPTLTVGINVSTSTNFRGRLEGNPNTGVVRITDAHPAGTYPVTVTGFDSSGIGTTKTFTLTVTTPATCNPMTFTAPTDFSAAANPRSVAVGDFNGDGNQDLAFANQDSGNVSILLGNGAGGFSAATNFPTSNGSFQVAVGDFNEDGDQDLVTANAFSNTVSVLFGNGGGTFTGIPNITVPNGPDSVAVGDFNGDGHQDIAIGHFNAATVSIILGDGTGAFGPIVDFPVNSNPLAVVVGDFNGDGHQDLATANAATNDVSILLGNGTGGFGAPVNFTVGLNTNPIALAVGLFDSGTSQDLVVANQNSSTVAILLGNGSGGFSAPANFDVGASPSEVALGDFNGDGNQDLAVAISSGGVSVLLGDGTGSFSAATDFGLGTARRSIAVGDFNHDGKQDLATANGGAPPGNVSVLLRICPPSFLIDNVQHNEGTLGTTTSYVFTVIKNGPTTLQTMVTFTTQDGTATLADNDYQFNTGTLKFAPTDTSLTATVIVNGDNIAEPNETFRVHLSNPVNATISAADGTGTITDDDQPAPTPTPTPTPSATASPSGTPCSSNDVIVDGGFETGGIPNTFWNPETSTNFGTPLCDVPSCGTGGGASPPRTGAFWLWFGGVPAPETATLGQTVTIPAGGSATLRFWMRGGTVTTPFTDVVNVRVDGAIVQSFLEPAVAEAAYTERVIDLTAFANGASHALLFEYIGPSTGTGSFVIDDVSLIAGGPCPSPSPSGTPSPTATVPPTPSPTPTATPTPTPGTPTPTPPPGTPTPTPSSTPAQALNLSTRMRVETGDNVGIGGFIITGTAPMHVLIRAIGPSLAPGISDSLADPVLELHGPGAFVTITDDNWRDDPVQEAAILATGIQPSNDLEAAIDATLAPGTYTAIIAGKNNGTGVALVEIYDLSAAAPAKLSNISTRAPVSTGDNIVIAGFILGNGSGLDQIILRGIGPSLICTGLPNGLADPTLQLRDANGALISLNNDWQDNPAQAAIIAAAGLAPSNDLESAIAATLPPGSYTALLAGLNNGTGIGLVEVYDIGDGSGVPVPSQGQPCTSPTPGTPSPTPASSPTPTPTASPSPASLCIENFDGVIAPALPAGWVATNAAGPDPVWITTPTIPDTAPNDAVVKDPPEISDKRLDTRNISINSASAQLSFRNSFNLQDTLDGGVLEVSSPNIGGGAFTDITNAAVGGSFVAGGYTDIISTGQGNPIAGRMAWSGNSGGYISTVANLGPNVNGQTIKLRFRLGTDQTTGAGGGWRVDTISIVGGACP